MEISISFKKARTIVDLIKQIEPIFSLKKQGIFSVKLNLDIDVSFIKPEYLTLVVATCKWAKENNIIIEYDITKNKLNYYPYRINFFKLLELNETEPFFRRFSNSGKFIEITPLEFDNTNNVSIDSKIIDDVMRIIIENYNIDSSVYKCLNYCLWEQVDNIQNHSSAKGIGYIVAQHYPKNQEISFCIADTGIGVFEALTKNPKSEYKSLTYKQAIDKCIDKKVTNGNGMGNGLYHTVKFIKENKGNFILYSGNYYIEIENGIVKETKRGPFWQGTFIYETICTNVPVDFSKTFDNCPIPDSVLDCDDMLSGLWDD